LHLHQNAANQQTSIKAKEMSYNATRQKANQLHFQAESIMPSTAKQKANELHSHNSQRNGEKKAVKYNEALKN
jgi:hypothetical protein